ncbi:glycerophosphodiester phosphodiesterase family protein [Campylobacter sp.]|uniref:glycerophosphodiester phosphodiesterase family protein n=1 Tax=Campylobacter sp. TaxID=205 RepID=UPI0026DAB5F2|nr:glycerophosphodiester phosphodiesterase family protein [Campylobacter sp.]MDO4673803.1 glycerophosphodiester phosphodiesterase family protein [Campylobacter sp.]
MKVIMFSFILSLSLFANPLIIAHRGGTADAPENTLTSIKLSLKNKVDAVWISVQMTKDKQLALYRPSDLSALTDSEGKISDFTLKQLAQIQITKSKTIGSIFNDEFLYIPALSEVLDKFPDTHFFIDLKSPDANDEEQAKILLETLKQTESLNRVRVYSTNDDYILALSDEISRFVTRGQTLKKLADVSLSHLCQQEEAQDLYYGLEFQKTVELVEKFTLGEGITQSTLTWDKEAMDCFRQNGGKVILFGINDAQSYERAKDLKAYGVMVDSPQFFKDR